MNALLFAFLGLVGFVSAQSYECSAGFCSSATYPERADVLGCLYFCYLDSTPDLVLERVEINGRFDEWNGADLEATLDEFLVIHREIVPACDTELTSAFNLLALLDNVTETISQADVDRWYQDLVDESVPPTEPVPSTAFQTWWGRLDVLVNDPTCTLPYP